MSYGNPLGSVSVYRMRRVRGYYTMAGVFVVLALLVLLLALFGGIDVSRLRLVMVAVGLAACATVPLYSVYITRLELSPEGVTLRDRNLTIQSPWSNVERLGPSPRNPAHMAIIFRAPAPVFEGKMADAFRGHGLDMYLDIDNFIANPHIDDLLSEIRHYAPHA